MGKWFKTFDAGDEGVLIPVGQEVGSSRQRPSREGRPCETADVEHGFPVKAAPSIIDQHNIKN